MIEMTSIEQRLMDLERRVAILEGADQSQLGSSAVPTTTAGRLITVEVRNKRYDPQNAALDKYEDHIWFDCYYTLSSASKPTRAVKGLLEFGDLFGEVKFRLNTTLNFSLEPGKVAPQLGIGFNFNQFMEEHQWMLATDLKDMTVHFEVLNAIFSDGTSEVFS